jgi:glycerophosphoryl diester phosphodiesterase
MEFDIKMTKDKRLVLMHDAAVDRTTNGRGRVADLTLEEIRRLDAGRWKGAQFAGEHPPTFEEALAMMPMNIWLNVHVHSLPNEAELVEAAAREIVRQKRTHQTFLAVGHRGAEAARRICPEILICNMERQGGKVQEYVMDTVARRDAFIQLLRQYGVNWPNEIRRLKEAGVRINYCCINEPGSLAALYAAGVDFVLTDEVERMVEAARQAGVEPWKPIFRSSVAVPEK